MSGQPVPILIAVFVFAGLLIIFQWGVIKRKWYELRLQRAIKKLGKKVLRNVSVPDGMDGLVHVEYLILAPTAIFLVYVRRFKGVIFAGDNMDLWTQVVDGSSFKFNNPLFQMDEAIVSVKSIMSDSDVKGYLVFTDESEFPKGKPEQVLLLSDLKKKACRKIDQVSDKLQEDWERLRYMIR